MALGRLRKGQSFQFHWMLRIKIFSFVLLFLLCLFSVNKIKESNQFPIQHVKVYGVKHLDPLEMQSMLASLVTKGFFTVDVDLIKERILQMPWVADVSVRRVWPNQIVIEVTEHNPIARWNETSLLSASGEIFNPEVSTIPTNLPHFLGPEGDQIRMLTFYSKINHLLRPLHLKIAQLELTPYFAWNMEFTDGMKVHLGYKDVLTRINHFVKVYPKVVGERATDIDYVDLRYPNGLAVRWKTVS